MEALFYFPLRPRGINLYPLLLRKLNYLQNLGLIIL
jgi:hypothetical protein